MIQAPWHLRRWLRRQSRVGSSGLLLLAVCLALDLALLLPAHTRLVQLREEAALSTATVPAVPVPDRQTLAAQQLTSYYSYFPPQESAPDWLNKIYLAANEQSLQLAQGEYRVQPAENGKIVRYHITLPVEGSYTQIRHFIAAVLATIPNASLDHISFERQKIEDPAIEAKVTLTLYLAVGT